jgi:hypothetical protein
MLQPVDFQPHDQCHISDQHIHSPAPLGLNTATSLCTIPFVDHSHQLRHTSKHTQATATNMLRFATIVLIACALAAVQARELQQAKFKSVGDALTSPQNAQLSTLLAAIKVISAHDSHSCAEIVSECCLAFVISRGASSRYRHLLLCGSDSISSVQSGSCSISYTLRS